MEKLLYNDIYSAVNSHSSDLKLNQSSTPCEIRNAIRWVMRDNPDIFWFAHQYHYDEESSTVHFQYTFSLERVKTILQSINDVIKNDFCIEYVKKLNLQEQVAYEDVTYYKGLLEEYTRELLFCMKHDFLEEIPIATEKIIL